MLNRLLSNDFPRSRILAVVLVLQDTYRVPPHDLFGGADAAALAAEAKSGS